MEPLGEVFSQLDATGLAIAAGIALLLAGTLIWRYVGGEPIAIPHQTMHETFSVRGKDPSGLARALSEPGVATTSMALHRTVKGLSIEWGLVKFYVEEILTDPDRISALLERGVALAQQLDALGSPAVPDQPSPMR